MVRILWSRAFEKSFRTLAPAAQNSAFRAVEKLIQNPRHPSLNLEKLRGTADFWSIRVNQGFRILLSSGRDEDGDFYRLEDVGSHDIYRRL